MAPPIPKTEPGQQYAISASSPDCPTAAVRVFIRDLLAPDIQLN